MPQQWSLDRERLRVRPSPRSGDWEPESESGHFRKLALLTARSALPPSADVVSFATHV